MTATPADRGRFADTDVDVLIVGAGISGIGAACQLRARRPGTSFAVLEGRASLGGTWDLFRYPGIRSDSDMSTFGYGFQPWTRRRAIAEGHSILDYLRRTAHEHGVERHIRYGHRVVGAEFSSAEGRWTVTAQVSDPREPGPQGAVESRAVTLTARFLFLGTGYYDYDSGFTPDFPGATEFEGRVVHPQHWPEDLDHTGKRVVVIGSGATAVTLVPSMAPEAEHVSMLQRSPSYVFSMPSRDRLAAGLRRLVGERLGHRLIRRRNIIFTRGIYKACRRTPGFMRKLLIAHVRRRLPHGFDVDTHFSPAYDPWDQRLCVVPDGDLFEALSSGRASVVTDRIARFTRHGLLLESGRELPADLVVTATGLNMVPFGGIRLSVDGRQVRPRDTTAFRAMMLDGVPNLVFALGYTNLSWTLKVDLVCEHFCRLLDHMDAHGHDIVQPVLTDTAMERVPLMNLSAGYVRRAIGAFPRAGTRGPWTVEMAYEKDVRRLRGGPVADDALRFSSAPAAVPAPRAEGRR
ncbi:flavin-containing monooxygenase [Nocardiopsis metallicus]|uniref:Cation diffusion facilitator CzcD-associated flavoprotein CzcO n=1 Tax=Nocardiopsis metallicus TaxID=179819 RepID=A0A840WKM0_9ACTN|nr:NAD(P)/FAD-dependent oxidoreductase [Nocardiopsis metallicus]MBB5490648.1 cation diffusion facilitator CzcD-associated flavoprotein CzcO [Nocardiopsis metallicus]